jgi:UDP-N-acetylmuramoyl-L-alanyl-D-glutamate--2,6-diaminopimelate ligase
MVTYERFPALFVGDQQLIWDTRQTAVAEQRLVFSLEGSEQHLIEELRAISGAIDYRESAFVQISARRALAELSAKATDFASESLKVFAVTGTNGKSTTNALVVQLLQHLGLGPTAELGTLGLRLYNSKDSVIADAIVDTGFTSPEAPALHALCKSLRESGFKNLCFEASSHAMALDRCAGVDIDVAAFTNLTHDHLDFHKTFENYRQAKLKLFNSYLLPHYLELWPEHRSKKSKSAVIHTGSNDGSWFERAVHQEVQKVTFKNEESLKVVDSSIDGLCLQLNGETSPRAPLIGLHNAENLATAALSVQALTQLPLQEILKHFSKLKAPAGRLERVNDGARKGRHVFVDYAHTPDALNRALTTLSQIKGPSARLSVVFGCGGDRDKTKRPVMGQIAVNLADNVIVTSDNPRTENPSDIITEIVAGIDPARATVVVDRRLAVLNAVKALKPGDVLLIAGKGHETYQSIGQSKTHFSDVEEASLALKA